MRIPMKYLVPVAVIVIALFAILILTSRPTREVVEAPPHPGYEDPPEYLEGVPLHEMGLELPAYCESVQVTDGLANKKIPAISVSGGIGGRPYTTHVIWTEPEKGAREIWESIGPIDGSEFSLKRPISKPDGKKSFNPVAVSGALKVYLGFMDESVNIREIWFSAGDAGGWTDIEPVSDLGVDSRSWGANPMAFYDAVEVYEVPLVLWFDHRFIKHEVLMKARMAGTSIPIEADSPVLEDGDWGNVVRVTDDDWFQFDPHSDWSSSFEDLEDNVIHLVYMDSRYGKQEDKHTQHEGNCEIFYRSMHPAGPVVEKDELGNRNYADTDWIIGDEVQLSFTEGLSDLPRVCGKRFFKNTDLNTAFVVWHELDVVAGTAEVQYCEIDNGKRGKLYRINPPGTLAINPEIISVPISGHEDLKVVAYQQYEEGQGFPLGKANIYMRIIDGDSISLPLKVSESNYTCSHPRMTRPGYTLEEDIPLLIAWSEYRAGKPDLTGESQVFFRSYLVRKIPQWPPESQTYRREREGD